jgi:hypothetical protein
LASGSTRRIRTRSCNGRSFIDGLLGPNFGDDLALYDQKCQRTSHDMGGTPPNTMAKLQRYYSYSATGL